MTLIARRPFLEKIRDYWNLYFIRIDAVIAVLIFFIYFFYSLNKSGHKSIVNLMEGEQVAIYSTLATINGALLGFMITATSIIFGYISDDKFAHIRKSRHYDTLWKSLKSTIFVLTVATLISILGILFDRPQHSNFFIKDATLFISVLGIIRLARALYILKLLLQIEIDSAKSKSNM